MKISFMSNAKINIIGFRKVADKVAKINYYYSVSNFADFFLGGKF